MTDLDKAVLEARYHYRKRWDEWMIAKNKTDAETRVAATDALAVSERQLLDICRRHDRG